MKIKANDTRHGWSKYRITKGFYLPWFFLDTIGRWTMTRHSAQVNRRKIMQREETP